MKSPLDDQDWGELHTLKILHGEASVPAESIRRAFGDDPVRRMVDALQKEMYAKGQVVGPISVKTVEEGGCIVVKARARVAVAKDAGQLLAGICK